MFKNKFVILLAFLILNGIVALVIKKHNSKIDDDFKSQTFYGRIVEIRKMDRGFLNLSLKNGEDLYLGTWFNYNNFQLMVLDSIAKDSGTMKIEVYRDSKLVYTEQNDY